MVHKTIEQFIQESEQELENRKDHYNQIKETIITDLEKICKKHEGISVVGRIKESQKIREKIFRKNYYSKYKGDAIKFIDDLPDGIGIRIICSLNSDEEKIVKSIKESQDSGSYSFEVCTENQPQTQKNGLDIYRMDGFYNDEEKVVRFELQVKSQTHNLWGEVEHSLFYKNYDFIIGGDVFNGFMLNIYKELEIIDDEIKALKKYLKKDVNDKNSELREIATRIISERFEKNINSIIGCAIDLREVYVLLSEISIKFDHMNDDEIIKSIQNLTVKLKDASDIDDSDVSSLKFKLDESCIGTKYLDIARLINSNLSSGDIFWIYFYIIYKKLNPNNDYSKNIGDLSCGLMEIYKDLSDEVVLLNGEDEDEDIDIAAVINTAIFYAAEDINKISFFSTSYYMNTVKNCVRERLLHIEEQYAKYPTVVFSDNKEAIVVYLYISIMLSLNEKIVSSRLDKFNFKKMCNDYQIQFSKAETESIKKDLSGFKQLNQFIFSFGEENES